MARSERLLLNILPEQTAKELKEKGSANAKLFVQSTVLFTDFKEFTAIAEQMAPKQLVELIDLYFRAYDGIVSKHGLEKIKTIGDSYMAVGGVPNRNRTHATDAVRAAIEMCELTATLHEQLKREGKQSFQIRIGLHSGPVVAGVVGEHKFQYDIWGDTVNTASRTENHGEVGKVNISEATYDLVKDQFACEYRGEMEVKGKGRMKMYFVSSKA